MIKGNKKEMWREDKKDNNGNNERRGKKYERKIENERKQKE